MDIPWKNVHFHKRNINQKWHHWHHQLLQKWQRQGRRWIQVWRIKPKQNVTFTNIILKKTYVHLWQVLSIVFVIFPIIWINLKVCRISISISLREILKKWTHIKCVHYFLIRFLFHLLTTRQNHKTL